MIRQRLKIQLAVNFFKWPFERLKLKMEKVVKMEKFSKVKFMQKIGLLTSEFNCDTGEFETCWRLRLKSYLLLIFLRLTFPLRLTLSYFYPVESLAQLWIGNLYLVLADQKGIFALIVSIGR